MNSTRRAPNSFRPSDWYHPVNIITGIAVALSSGAILALSEEEPLDWVYITFFALFWIITFPVSLYYAQKLFGPKSKSNV